MGDSQQVSRTEGDDDEDTDLELPAPEETNLTDTVIEIITPKEEEEEDIDDEEGAVSRGPKQAPKLFPIGKRRRSSSSSSSRRRRRRKRRKRRKHSTLITRPKTVQVRNFSTTMTSPMAGQNGTPICASRVPNARATAALGLIPLCA